MRGGPDGPPLGKQYAYSIISISAIANDRDLIMDGIVRMSVHQTLDSCLPTVHLLFFVSDVKNAYKSFFNNPNN